MKKRLSHAAALLFTRVVVARALTFVLCWHALIPVLQVSTKAIPLGAPTGGGTDLIAVVRHAPSVNGTIQGSAQMMTGESLNLNSGAAITSDLRVPGTPSVNINGTPTFGGTVTSGGSAQPTGSSITLNSGSTLGHLAT